MNRARPTLAFRFRPLGVKMLQRQTPWRHVAPFHPSLRSTIAEHLADPQHRFHPVLGRHDWRAEIAASGNRQRVRSRAPSW